MPSKTTKTKISKPIKKLHRSSHDKIIAGVAGGLGEYFELDAVLFRIAFVGLTLLNGIGLWLYLALALILPKNNNDSLSDNAHDLGQGVKDLAGRSRFVEHSRFILGLVFVLIGLSLLLKNFLPHWPSALIGKLLFSAIIIYIGCKLIFKRS